MAFTPGEFASSLRVEACRVRETPNLIFLCGGKTVDSGNYKSVRDFFHRYLRRKAPAVAERVRLAEVVNSWFDRDVFPDLLDLEHHIADLSDITIIFVESPGSIAELGAFAASPVLRARTLAVLNESFETRRTFIADGPVQALKNVDEGLVHYYEWDSNPKRFNSVSNRRQLTNIAKELTRVLEQRDGDRPVEQNLNTSSPGHLLLLVADLANIQGVVTHGDVVDFLKGIGSDHTRVQVSRYLSLLESMAFVTIRHYGPQTFYVGNLSTSYLSYGFKDDARFRDLVRVRGELRQALKDEPSKAGHLKILRSSIRTRKGDSNV